MGYLKIKQQLYVEKEKFQEQIKINMVVHGIFQKMQYYLKNI